MIDYTKKIDYILMSWQVSNQCMALVNDKIIVPTKVGALMTELNNKCIRLIFD